MMMRRYTSLSKLLEAQEDLVCYYEDQIIPFEEVDFKKYNIEVPKFLYHVTVIANKESIARDGIQPMSQEKKLWKGCNDHYTYWSRTLSAAISFIESLHKDDMLLCYRAELKSFQLSKLFVDRMATANFEEYNVPVTFEYHDGIEANKLVQLSKDEVIWQLEHERAKNSRLYSFIDA